MSVNLMLRHANNFFKQGKFFDGLTVLKNIWLKYPKNIKIFEEINKLKKNFSPQLKTSLSQNRVNRLFEMHNEGDTDKAIQSLEELLQINPKDFYVLNLLGTFNGLIKEYDKAIKFQKLSINLNPFDGSNYVNYGLTIADNGNASLALSFLEIGKILDFKNVNTNKKLAELYYKAYKYELSSQIYEDLMKFDEVNFNTKLDYVRSLIKAKKANNALTFLKKLENNKDYEDKILTLQGLANFSLNNIFEAKKALNKALTKNLYNSDAHLIFGLIYESLNMIDMSIASYLEAIKYNQKNYIAFNNLAACYSFLGNVDLSILNFKKAIEINPFFYDAIYRLGQMQMYNKNFKEGWINFKKRWLSEDYSHKYHKTSKPLLHSLNNKKLKIFVWNEQGLGDQVMYGSMFDQFSKYAKKLIVRMDERLINIFKKKHPKIEFLGNDDFISENQYDCHIPFGNLGNFFRLKSGDFKNTNFPYISGEDKTKNFITKKYKDQKTLLVGLSWSSSNHKLSNDKSLSLENLFPILNMKNIKFIDLEYKKSFKEVNDFYEKYGIKIIKEDSIDNFSNIIGLCSIIEACDFVISCSNTNAHLCGALNKKLYLLLPKGKGRLWNWSSNNNQSVWYPNTQIFQQKIAGDWTFPIINLKKEILTNGKMA